jgi:hypothetical protein
MRLLKNIGAAPIAALVIVVLAVLSWISDEGGWP